MPNNERNSFDEKILLEWNAYERPLKKWSKEFYSTVVVMAVLASIIFYSIEGIMPVLVIWSLVFMLWAMSRTEPRTEKYAVSSWGIKTTERTYRFESINQFWFETKWGSRLMRINLAQAPWHIVLLIDPGKEKQIKQLMLQKTIYQEPPVTWMDRLVKWMGEKLPLE